MAPHRIKGRTYELSHLHPFRYPLLLPERPNQAAREVEIRVAFSAHTFTAGPAKVFPIRYQLSKKLPEVARSLENRKCFFTDGNNYFVIELPESLPAGFEYWVFFDVRGVPDPDAASHLCDDFLAGSLIGSAYHAQACKGCND